MRPMVVVLALVLAVSVLGVAITPRLSEPTPYTRTEGEETE
ncbi:hypothetical protein [Streptomyces sp. Ag109_G2-6]|nr:hypothetical protein [Streptomyces sp. Ag109_G2-6]